MGPSTHASVFLGVSRQAGLCAAPLALSTPGAPMAIRCAALGAAEASRLSSAAAAGPSAADPSAVARDRPGAATAALARPGTNSGPAPLGTDLQAAGVRLTARLHLEEPAAGTRPFHPCLRPECGCLGVYYTCFGGGSSEVRVTMALEAAAGADAVAASSSSRGAAASASSSSSSSSGASSAVAAEVSKAFAASAPSLGLFHNACGQAGLTSSHQPVTPTRSAYDAATGAWHVWFRPKRTTGGHLAQVVARWAGHNTVMSGGFEVRTKPHKWVLLQGLPRDADDAAVEAFLARCHAGIESPVVTVVRPDPAPSAPADASLPHAFVQLRDRSAAHEVMKGYRALDAAARGGVLLSFLAGLSRAVAEDPTLRSVAVPTPSLACPAFVQQPAGVERSRSQDTVEAPAARAGKRSRDEEDQAEGHGAKRACSPCSSGETSSSGVSVGSPGSQRGELGEASSVGSCPDSPAALTGEPWAGSVSAQREPLPAPLLPVEVPGWRVAGHFVAPAPVVGDWARSPADALEAWDLDSLDDGMDM